MLLGAILVTATALLALAIYRTRPGQRRSLLFEVALIGTAYLVYKGVRTLTEGSARTAIANGERIIEIQETLGIYIEPALNAAAVSHSSLMMAMNWVYIWGHWPVIVAVGIWLFRSCPAGYRVTRNAFIISGIIGFLFFALVPTAPPRLIESAGFMDTITDHSNSYRLLQPPSLTNQYAAFPSLHFGWNLLIGIALVRYARRDIFKAVGVILPLAMFFATIFTANHFLLDLGMGALVALAGLFLATQLSTWHPPALALARWATAGVLYPYRFWR